MPNLTAQANLALRQTGPKPTMTLCQLLESVSVPVARARHSCERGSSAVTTSTMGKSGPKYTVEFCRN